MPDLWLHHTPRGTFAGPLDGPRRRHRPPHLARMLVALAIVELRARYRGQALGWAWSILYPLVMMVAITVVLRDVVRIGIPDYPVFVLIGIVYWQLVARAWSSATRLYADRAHVARRVAFPRYLLPLAVVCSYALSFAIEVLLVGIVALAYPGALQPGATWLALPLAIASLAITLGALAVTTATLFAMFRDVAYLVDTGLLLLYWATPILYDADMVPSRLAWIGLVNPFSAPLVTMRAIALHDALPSASVLAALAIAPVVAIVLAALTVRTYGRRVADRL